MDLMDEGVYMHSKFIIYVLEDQILFQEKKGPSSVV